MNTFFLASRVVAHDNEIASVLSRVFVYASAPDGYYTALHTLFVPSSSGSIFYFSFFDQTLCRYCTRICMCTHYIRGIIRHAVCASENYSDYERSIDSIPICEINRSAGQPVLAPEREPRDKRYRIIYSRYIYRYPGALKEVDPR